MRLPGAPPAPLPHRLDSDPIIIIDIDNDNGGDALEAARFFRPLDFVYDEVKRRIMLNELKPVEVLTELGLARGLGCSQGTIREALFRLQEDGLVTRAGRRGTTVTRLDPDEAQEILALRKRIEMRGALKAVLAVDEKALARLEALALEMESAATADDEPRLTEL